MTCSQVTDLISLVPFLPQGLEKKLLSRFSLVAWLPPQPSMPLAVISLPQQASLYPQISVYMSYFLRTCIIQNRLYIYTNKQTPILGVAFFKLGCHYTHFSAP